MIFCGQCGLQLAPGSTRCPRCGTAIEESDVTAGGELHSDDPTIASPSLLAPHQTQQSNDQQPLILRPGAGNSGNNYGNQTAAYNYGTGNQMDQVTYLAPQTQMGGSYAGYPPQPDGNGYPPQISGSGYPTQNPVYPRGSYPDYTTNGGGGYPMGISYPNMSPQTGYQPMPGHYQEDERSSVSARGRTTGLVLVLLGLIFILTAVVLFALQQRLI